MKKRLQSTTPTAGAAGAALGGIAAYFLHVPEGVGILFGTVGAFALGAVFPGK